MVAPTRITQTGLTRLTEFASFALDILRGGELKFKILFLFSMCLAAFGLKNLFVNLNRLGILDETGVWRSRDGTSITTDFKSIIVIYEIYTLNCYEALPDFHLEAGWTVVDAGASVGLFTAKAARAVGPAGRVISYEPEPVSFEMLCQNVRKNTDWNAEPFSLALGASSGIRRFGMRTTTVGGSLFLDEGRALSVRVVTLDSEATRLRLSKIDYLKVDVEGAEMEVLNGSREMLEDRKIARVVVETHGESLASEAKELLESFGYRVEVVNVFPAFFTGHPFPTLYASLSHL